MLPPSWVAGTRYYLAVCVTNLMGTRYPVLFGGILELYRVCVYVTNLMGTRYLVPGPGII